MNQLLTHGIDEELLGLKELVIERLHQLQCMKITESIQTIQMQINFPPNLPGEWHNDDRTTFPINVCFVYNTFLGVMELLETLLFPKQMRLVTCVGR